MLREKRRKKEKMLENKDSSSDSEEEESASKARSIKSKAIHESMLCLLIVPLVHVKKQTTKLK